MNDTTSQSVAPAQSTSLPKHLIVTPFLSIMCFIAMLVSIPLIDLYVDIAPNAILNGDHALLHTFLFGFLALTSCFGLFCAFLSFIVILITYFTKGSRNAYLISISSFLIALSQIIILAKIT